jgi:hypothetical protein
MKLLSKFSLLAAAGISCGALSATDLSLTPLETIISELQNESKKENLMHPIASRCAANRIWLGLRQQQSFEITGKPQERNMSEAAMSLGETWTSLADEIFAVIDPTLQSSEVKEINLKRIGIQVEAYTESAEIEKALTGHYIPKTWSGDGMICKNFEENMPIFGVAN